MRSLTRIDEEGSVYASLAHGWEISDEGRTYTFHLRDGLRFSDGTPLTAADVRRSWLGSSILRPGRWRPTS